MTHVIRNHDMKSYHTCLSIGSLLLVRYPKTGYRAYDTGQGCITAPSYHHHHHQVLLSSTIKEIPGWKCQKMDEEVHTTSNMKKAKSTPREVPLVDNFNKKYPKKP
jgi:hypothetical protein